MAKQAARKKSPAKKRAPARRSRRGGTRAAARARGVRVALGVAVVAGLVVVAFDSHRVASASMEDSLLFGDRVAVDRVSSWFGEPEPGDVVVFEPPDENDGRTVVKRCVAVAGQRVEILDKAVYVDGERFPDPPFSKFLDVHLLPASQSGRDNLAARTVPTDHIFVLGDNRDHSRDSRHYGAVPLDRVVGRARWIWYSDGGDGVRWSRLGSAVP